MMVMMMGGLDEEYFAEKHRCCGLCESIQTDLARLDKING